MPDAFFGKSPHWEWWIVGYFFAGGLAGGCYALAAIADLFGRGRHRRAANAGYLVVVPFLVIGWILLLVDLHRPERFWHMLFMSERFPRPVFKWWSPMSIGAWALALLGAVATVPFVGALADEGRIRASWARRLREGPAAKVAAVVGGALALFVAAYTGILLSVTNRVVWAETNWWGALFVLSGISSAAALLTLLLRRRGRDPQGESRSWLSQFDVSVLLLEAVVVVALVVSLGTSATHWGTLPSIALALGALVLGIAVPVFLHRRHAAPGTRAEAWAALLVLLGGVCLRVLVVLPVEAL